MTDPARHRCQYPLRSPESPLAGEEPQGICQDRSLTLLFGDAPDRTALLRTALERADFSTAGVRALLGDHFLGFLAGSELPALLRRTEGGSPLCSLVRLFLVGSPVDRRSAEVALAPLRLEEAERAGLVSDDGNSVRGVVRLRPYEAQGRQFMVASDAPAAGGGAGRATLAPDHVIGVGASSAMLAKMTVRGEVGRTLDVGTGSGVQAMHASLHSAAVTATDVNPPRSSLCSIQLRAERCPQRQDARVRPVLVLVRRELRSHRLQPALCRLARVTFRLSRWWARG